MKRFTILLVFSLVHTAAGQSISLSGTVYDLNGAVIVGARVKLISEKKRVIETVSSIDGKFSVPVPIGIYDIRISAEGFETKVFSHYIIVNPAYGKMVFDSVLLGSNSHEPCGYGGDCPLMGITTPLSLTPSTSVSDRLTYRKIESTRPTRKSKPE